MKKISSLAILAALAGASAACAQAVQYDITVDTSALGLSANAPFSLDFQLNDGSGTGSGPNTATVTVLSFGGGSPTGSATLAGGASGDLASGITLTESSAFNEAYQGFNPGTTLSFHVGLSKHTPSTSTPDLFSFAILDKNLANLPATGVGDTLFSISIDASGATPTAGSTTGADAVTVRYVPAPEPSEAAFAGAGLAAACAAIRLWTRRGRK